MFYNPPPLHYVRFDMMLILSRFDILSIRSSTNDGIQ